MFSLILFSCFLIWQVLAQTSLPYYILLVPAEVHYPSTERACVHVSGAMENLTLTITLQTESRDTFLYQHQLTESSLIQCFSFQTPPPVGGTEEVATIHISLMGQIIEITENKQILIRTVAIATIIQTSQPIYKPGQTVEIRILSFDREFRAVNDKCPLVELKDPNGNRIGQWLNLTPHQGFIDLSFSLAPEAAQGTYSIHSPNGHQTFHVLEFTIPKFEVVILLPSIVTLLDEAFQLKVCGRYTFGKPVQGDISVRLCRRAVKYHWFPYARPQDLCTVYNGQTEKNGCMKWDIRTDIFNLRSYDYQLNFEAKASLVEHETGVQINGTESCRVSPTIAKVTFDGLEISESYYKIGLRYKGTLKLEGADGKPMKSKTLYLVEEYNLVSMERVYETDEFGQAHFTLDTKPWNGNTVRLSARYQKENMEFKPGELSPYYKDAHQTLQPFSAITNSFLKVQPVDQTLTCDQQYQIEIDYLIRGSELSRQQDKLQLNYVVMAKGELALNGKLELNVSRYSVLTGTIELPLLVTADIAPKAQILVYAILANGWVAGDTEEFKVDKCFKNKVTAGFSDYEKTPGSNVSLHLQASPGSLCSLKVVDEGLLFMRPEAEISSDLLYNFISLRNQYGYPYRVREDDGICWRPRPWFSKRSLRGHELEKRHTNWMTPRSPDMFKLIKRMGLKILTNTIVKQPKECNFYPPVAALSLYGHNLFDNPFYPPPPIMVDDAMDSFSQASQPSLSLTEVTKKIRKSFPETWTWQLIPLGKSGEAKLELQLPDTITEWKAMMLCMGDIGLGLSSTVTLRAFQPFFIYLTLPYSVVRGESFPIKAAAFNFLNRTLMVNSKLRESPELKLTKCPSCLYTQCVAPGETKVFAWEATALGLGSVQVEISAEAILTGELCGGEVPTVPQDGACDILMRPLQIKPEGMPIEKSQNFLLCAEENLSSQTFSISLPQDTVPDSARAEISIVGDFMGKALDNLENLLDLPTGCGEQNMVKFAPIIYVLRYLENTKQLTDVVRVRGNVYLVHGYQQELGFKRYDGSFSAFGEKDEEGNTWLTAFVIQMFYAASYSIFVDEKHLYEAIAWLKNNQLPSGCFIRRGTLFKSSLQGGVNDETTLTAYVAAAILQIKWPEEDEMLQKALQCLKNSIPNVTSTYTMALLSFTFTLAKDFELRNSLLRSLYEKATIAGDQVYWLLNPTPPTKTSPWAQPNSLEVQVASYVILSHLMLENLTKNDICNASKIASWLRLQQTPHGGFESTQDTLVALQALSQYAEISYTGQLGLEVTVQLAEEGGDKHQFWVDNTTRFLLQKTQLDKVPGNYNAGVKGEGCVNLQLILKYNTKPAEKSNTFELRLNSSRDGCRNQSISCYNLTICVQYIGQRQRTNMILIQAGLLSGFSAIEETINKLENHPLVKKIEIKMDEIVIYINELSHETQCFSFLAKQDVPVENLASQLVKVYDFYQREEEADAMYNLSRL
ncbi:alpha-2-macroglobulin-like protein 1 isoform X2 [Xenopus laevis]|uniref:Alpha-2-macroglobulin-like protein 1 isoform X2 n=1 Tax=Xenopus laevis TaxID=8355 RepID=A0A8J1L9B0_XENLA|nr:alpha-2-macroglobulin-like protein 1 isoform X2 [Xenopus laevis]